MTHSISMTRYGDWWIERNPKPIPDRRNDWDYWHKDYDGAEDGNDDRCGTAASKEQAMRDIDEYEAEHNEMPNLLAEQRKYHTTRRPPR